MRYKNRGYVSIQETKQIFAERLDKLSLIEQVNTPLSEQFDLALNYSNNANFKILHPLFFKGYRMPHARYSEEPINVVGLDIETDHTTGQPKLMGYWYPNLGKYGYDYNPSLDSFFRIVKNIRENSRYNLGTWGNLDIQCIIRLFEPDEQERVYISRGMSSNPKQNVYICGREFDGVVFYIASYIPGRSLKLGYMENGRDNQFWVFNISQFYQDSSGKRDESTTRLGSISRGVGLPWKDFSKDTHLVDWGRFDEDEAYKIECIESNKQDANTVSCLSVKLQERFFEIFGCYPKLLVSTGSICDAAVSKMLSEDDYASNSIAWIIDNVWRKTCDEETITKFETLASEAFSAGYVDQFALGYFDNVFMSDIAAAYPHKIRGLHDLRFSRIKSGVGNLDAEYNNLLRSPNCTIETVLIRGKVTIPETLRYHPITLKTFQRENIRPIGTFWASYCFEERHYCKERGATFTDEEYVFVLLDKVVKSPLAEVSKTIGAMRDDFLLKKKHAKTPEEKILFDGQQYLAKIVDNSLYGKTVMTTEVIEEIDGKPEVTGYMAGDRYNILYGLLITARTRIQLAEACTAIVDNGGTPLMAMTDSIFWAGNPGALPQGMIKEQKTPGFFESVAYLESFYLLKTGQYEYKKGSDWFHKMRGLKVPWEYMSASESFYHKIISNKCATLSRLTHPEDIRIPVSTRRLITIGAKELQHLALIKDTVTEIVPFMLSSKQSERGILNWKDCINGHIFLAPIRKRLDKTHPLKDMTVLYSKTKHERITQYKRTVTEGIMERNDLLEVRRRLFITWASKRTGKGPPPGRVYRVSWEGLVQWYGVTLEQFEKSEGYDVKSFTIPE